MNLTPDEWTARSVDAARTAEQSATVGMLPCGHVTCVDINLDGDMFVFTSVVNGDLRAERGSTRYDAVEVAAFLRDVKAGRWDAVLAEAETLAAAELATA